VFSRALHLPNLMSTQVRLVELWLCLKQLPTSVVFLINCYSSRLCPYMLVVLATGLSPQLYLSLPCRPPTHDHTLTRTTEPSILGVRATCACVSCQIIAMYHRGVRVFLHLLWGLGLILDNEYLETEGVCL
jgi:hypothetical protein